jgi:mono/diheme cytochrome c family protein
MDTTLNEVTMRWRLLILALVCLPELQAQPPVKTVNELKAFYVAHCVRCHGQDGSSRNTLGKKLNAANFTDQRKMAKEVDTKLARTIRKGIFFGVVMPPFKKRLSEAEAMLLVTDVLRKAELGKAIAPTG